METFSDHYILLVLITYTCGRASKSLTLTINFVFSQVKVTHFYSVARPPQFIGALGILWWRLKKLELYSWHFKGSVTPRKLYLTKVTSYLYLLNVLMKINVNACSVDLKVPEHRNSDRRLEMRIEPFDNEFIFIWKALPVKILNYCLL